MATLWTGPKSGADSMPTTVGVWLVADALTPAGAPTRKLTPVVERGDGYMIEMTYVERVPYPCRCAPPCKTRGWQTCPCHGRTDIGPWLAPNCCARFEVSSATWRAPDIEYDAPPPSSAAAPAIPRWRAPVRLDRVWAAPIRWYADKSPRIKWRAPYNPELPRWMDPIRVLEPWERTSRYPRDGERDCDACGECMADTLVSQGCIRHALC